MSQGRIHVLLVVNSLCVGGAEKHAMTLLNTLDTNRFRLSLAYLKDDRSLLPQVLAERAEGGVFCCGVSRKVDMQAVGRLANHVCEQAVDIILCTNTYSLLYAWLACLGNSKVMKKRPRIVEVFHSTLLPTFHDELQMLFYRPWILASDRLVYVCNNQREYWRKRGLRARADCVIHNGIDVNHFADTFSAEEKARRRQSFGFAQDDYVIGLCAAMRPEKMHGDLLQAVARLHRDGFPVRCLLIGDGPLRPELEALIATLGLQDCVRITGFAADVRPHVAICDVMTITSHWVETFSIAALEAMALGKPMVMTDIGGAREQVLHGRNGYLYRHGDIEGLAIRLRRLHDRQLRHDMSVQARTSVVERYSLERMVDAYSELFDDLMARKEREREARHAT